MRQSSSIDLIERGELIISYPSLMIKSTREHGGCERHTPYSLVAFLAAFPKISINIDKNLHSQQYCLSNLRWFIIPRAIVSAVLEGFKDKREHCYARQVMKRGGNIYVGEDSI